MEKPIVTIGVITYNSSKYVLETLESIKAQTYQPLKLIIGDDCSTDNTVELCRRWIEENKSRFMSASIIVPEHNTGVSANCNRVEDACDTEWYKGIAGDDILMPDCIQDYMEYVEKNPDMVLVFGRMKSFGASQETCLHSDNVIYNYDLFCWEVSDQYDYLFNVRNCIPAPTSFWNIIKRREIGIRNDERIPFQEDCAMWLNVLNKGIKLSLMDKVTVRYRIHEGSLSTSSIQSLKSFESFRLFDFYYKFSILYEKDKDVAIRRAVDYEIALYKSVYASKQDLLTISNSLSYRLGNFLLRPFIFLRKNLYRYFR